MAMSEVLILTRSGRDIDTEVFENQAHVDVVDVETNKQAQALLYRLGVKELPVYVIADEQRLAMSHDPEDIAYIFTTTATREAYTPVPEAEETIEPEPEPVQEVSKPVEEATRQEAKKEADSQQEEQRQEKVELYTVAGVLEAIEKMAGKLAKTDKVPIVSRGGIKA